MIEQLSRSTGSVVGLRVAGTVTTEDYERLVPDLERVIAEHGELNLFCRFDGMEGIEPGAIWEDAQFYAHNVSDLARLAVVKDRDWQGALARIGSLFGVETRVVDPSEEAEAWAWLLDEAEASTSEERGRRWTQAVENRLGRLSRDLRADVTRMADPRAQAMAETSAEVLDGLGTAFEHYRRQTEEA
jgi:hypothetical protein